MAPSFYRHVILDVCLGVPNLCLIYSQGFIREFGLGWGGGKPKTYISFKHVLQACNKGGFWGSSPRNVFFFYFSLKLIPMQFWIESYPQSEYTQVVSELITSLSGSDAFGGIFPEMSLISIMLTLPP